MIQLGLDAQLRKTMKAVVNKRNPAPSAVGSKPLLQNAHSEVVVSEHFDFFSVAVGNFLN